MPVAKSGSFIYLLYDEDNNLLYIGETGTNIKNRLISDGSGAHKIKNPKMFARIKTIKYCKTCGSISLTAQERKFIEQLLSVYLQPEYYGDTE